MLTRRTKAYSSFCSQTVSLSPVISSRLLRGYRSFTDFLEPRKSRLRSSKSMFNVKISRAACPCLSQLVSAQFVFETCLAARNCKKIHILAFKVIQRHWVRWQSRAIVRPLWYEFLLVIISNLGPISHRYWDTATYWPKIANFALPHLI